MFAKWIDFRKGVGIVTRLAMMKTFRASKIVAVPARFVMASTTSDAVEAAATLGVRDWGEP